MKRLKKITSILTLALGLCASNFAFGQTNLLTYGDIETANPITSFANVTTVFSYNSTSNPGRYYRVSNYSNYSGPNVYDHTHGNSSGHFLAFDGFNSSPNRKVWAEIISFNASSTYDFSFWAHNRFTGNSTRNVKLKLYVGSTYIQTYTVNAATGWQNFTASISGFSGSQEIRLEQASFSSSGYNDFGIDDLSLVRKCDLKADFNYCVDDCKVTFQNTSTGTGITSMIWNFGDGTSINNIANPIHYYGTGLYTVCLTISDGTRGCTDTKCIKIYIDCGEKIVKPKEEAAPNSSTSVEKVKEAASFVIAPNPVKESLIVSNIENQSNTTWNIVSITGKVMASGVVKSANLEINTQEYSKGMYYLVLTTEEGKKEVKSFVKQ